MNKSYASFELLIESGTEDEDEVKREALEWIRENVDELTGEDIEVVQMPVSEADDSRAFSTGDRVTGVIDNKQEVGTVVSLLLIGRDGPQAFVRFDNGELRGLPLDMLTLLD